MVGEAGSVGPYAVPAHLEPIGHRPPPVRRRPESTAVCTQLRCALIKRAWVEDLGESPDPALDRVE